MPGSVPVTHGAHGREVCSTLSVLSEEAGGSQSQDFQEGCWAEMEAELCPTP